MSSRAPHRLLRPHQVWTAFDFVVAAVGLGCLGIALWGFTIAAQAVAVISSLGRDCGNHECTHAATLVNRQVFTIPGSGNYGSGPPLRYCILTFDLDIGRRQAAVPDPRCDALPVSSPASVDVWHGIVVSVHTSDGDFGTYDNPANALPGGLFRMVGLLPFALCVAIVHYDLVHHPVFESVHQHIRGRNR